MPMTSDLRKFTVHIIIFFFYYYFFIGHETLCILFHYKTGRTNWENILLIAIFIIIVHIYLFISILM